MNSCYLSNGVGDSLSNPSRGDMKRFLEGLDPADEEHGAAWLSNELDDSLEYNATGQRLVFSRGNAPPRHMYGVSHERTLALWLHLVEGNLTAIEEEDWQPGLISAEHAEAARKLAKQWREESDRKWLLSMEPVVGERCQTSGCSLDRVRYSLFCRLHTYESMRGRPYTGRLE